MGGIQWLCRRSWAVLVTLDNAAEEELESHMDTATRDRARSQIADGTEGWRREFRRFRSMGSVGVSLDESKRIIQLVGVLNAHTSCLNVTGPSSGSPAPERTDGGWSWVHAGKLAKPQTVDFSPSAKFRCARSVRRDETKRSAVVL